MNNEFFLMKGEDILDFIDKGTRKSIEFNYIKEKGYKIVESYTPRLKYLDAVDNAYFKEQ
jgi:recombination protein U